MEHVSTLLTTREAENLAHAVRVCLGYPDAIIGAVTCQPLSGGASAEYGTSLGVYRVRGEAHVDRGLAPWSLVLKIFSAQAGNVSQEPRAWNYWAREGELAESGLLSRLPAGISAPAIYAITHADDGAICIWMEDVTDARPGRWDMSLYRLTAQHFGQFNGAYLTGAALPDYPWMSNGRTVEWGRVSQQWAPGLRDLQDTLIGAAVLPGETFAQTFALCERLDMIISAMECLPQCFCHHDAFRNNVLTRIGPTGAIETVAIDWAYCGHGRVGEEAGNLMAASANNLLIAPDEIGLLDQTVFAGYVDGLRQAGWQGDTQLARLGYTACAFVIFGLALRGFELMMLRTQSVAFEQSEARSKGRPHEEIFEHRRLIQPYLIGLGEEALRLAGALA